MERIVILTACALMMLPCFGKMRTWTSKSGKTLDAEFVEVDQGRVKLRTENGRNVSIDVTDLSQDDQTVIKNLGEGPKESGDGQVAAGTSAANNGIRTWSPGNGKSIDGEFVRVSHGRVILRGANGGMINLAVKDLSHEDRAYIKNLYKEAQERAKAKVKAAEEAAARQKAEEKAAILAKWQPGKISHHSTPDEIKASYHVYIPSTFDPYNPPPLVYAYSPGGSGKGQLNAMKASAEKAGWIVVGCDKLRNGMEEGHLREEAISIEDAIIKDVQASVPHDSKRVYLSGLSGGAMRSYRLAARRHDLKVAGILAFGGWLGGKDYQKSLTFQKGGAVAMINGDNDKAANSWTESDGKILKRYGWEVKVFQFPGGHQMAPPAVIDEAIDWIKKQALPK